MIPKVKIRPCTCDDTWTVSLVDDNGLEQDDSIWVKPGKRFQERLISAGETLKLRWVHAYNAMAHLNDT